MQIRLATLTDVPDLARMNHQFIRDEGHRNPMKLQQLAERMHRWLEGEYIGVIIEESDHPSPTRERFRGSEPDVIANPVDPRPGQPIGYAIFRNEPDHVYLRQFYIVAEHRRQGMGRQTMRWLWENAWTSAKRVRIDVLIDNHVGQTFWRSVGFADYCLTMEAEWPPPSNHDEGR